MPKLVQKVIKIHVDMNHWAYAKAYSTRKADKQNWLIDTWIWG